MLNQYSQNVLQLLADDLTIFPELTRAGHEMLDRFQKVINENIQAVDIAYQFDRFDIIPEMEKAVIQHIGLTESRKIGIQLYLSPSPVLVNMDRLFLQPLLYKLFTELLQKAKDGSTIKMHVTGNDGRCIAECINQGGRISNEGSDDYFKRYRITNPLHKSVTAVPDALSVYKKVIKDMDGELTYAFTCEKENYFRLKLPLG